MDTDIGLVSAPSLSAVRHRLNPYKLMSTVTSFVCIAYDCITITEQFSQHVDRGVLDDTYEKRDAGDNTIPEQIPTKAPNGVIQAYAKRDAGDNTIPEQIPTKAPNGVIQAY